MCSSPGAKPSTNGFGQRSIARSKSHDHLRPPRHRNSRSTGKGALDYFTDYFGFVPDYIDLMADEASRGLEGYVLMRQWSLAENPLGAKWVELMLCTINAAEFSSRFVNVHANGARAAGASEAEIVESVVCAIPVSGVAAWLPGADGIIEGRK